MKKCLSCAAVSVTSSLLAGLALSGISGCVSDPLPFDPRSAQAWELRTDTEIKAPALYPLPTTGETPYIPGETPESPTARFQRTNVPEGPPVRMPLQEVVHRAILNNMEIRVASYDTAIDQTRILEAEANFDPTVFSDINEQRIDKMTPGSLGNVVNPKTNQITTRVVNFDQEQLYTSDIGIRQNLPAGGKIEFKQEIDNVWSSPPRGLLSSFYQNDLSLTLTQPLLQNFGVAVNRARITIAENNARVSLLDFRKTVETTVLKIEQVYWQLVQANRDVATIEKLISSSEDLRAKLYRRRGNDVNNIQIEQVNAENSGREYTLIQLQSHVEDLSDELKQLMNDPDYPVSGGAIITPSEEGTEMQMRFNLDDQIETAMQNRYELGQQQVRIDSAEIAVDVARNNRLPSLTAQLQATVDGLGRNLNNALDKEGDFNHLGYQAGLQFTFPLGNRAAAAIWQRSLLQRMQAIVSYAGLVNQIALDVTTASRQVDTTWFRLGKARDSRLHYEKLVADQTIQDRSGDVPFTSDSVFVRLQNQNFLATAEQTEHQALNDYNYAIANLEYVKGTLLRYNNVMIEQEQLPFDMQAKGNPTVRQRLIGNEE
jgi:outer membrane protein TolC